MKYDLSLDEVLDSGFVIKVKGVPSWFDKLFNRSVDEKYVICHDGSNFICAQKIGSKEVMRLVEKAEDGIWCSEVKRGELGPEYRAPKLLEDLYWKAASHYAAQTIIEFSNELLEEVKEK